MGLNLKDPLVQIKITESVCGFVAVCSTVMRLYIRRGRYWWDDAWALFSMINLFIQFAAVFMHVENPDEISKTSRVAAYYLMAVTFYTIIWSARLSILYSIIRIDPDPVTRRRLKMLAAVFIACIFFFFAQLMWVCEPEPAWKNERSPQCELNKEVAICQVVSDALSDILLIVLPLRLIRGIRDKSLRRRLMLIFSTSIITTIVSLVHAYYIITVGDIKVVIAALVEDCMSLTVANVPVAATAVFKVFGVHDRTDDTDDSYADPNGGPGWRRTTFAFKSKMTGVFSTLAGLGGGGYGGLTTTGTCSTEMAERTVASMETEGKRGDFGVASLPGVAVGGGPAFGVRTVDLALEGRGERSRVDGDRKSVESVGGSTPVKVWELRPEEPEEKQEDGDRDSQKSTRNDDMRRLDGSGLALDRRRTKRDGENGDG